MRWAACAVYLHGVEVMGVLVAFLHRYLSPFAAGVCLAGATVVGNVPMTVGLVLAAGLLSFFSLPAGGRVIGRIARVTPVP